MRCSRIYISEPLSVGNSVEFPAKTDHYIKNVLRLKNDQNIILFNNKEAFDYTTQIKISKKQIQGIILSRVEKNFESPLHTTLIQAIGKPEHIDFVLQKATELGISEIQLFNSQRTQTPLKGTRLDKKLDHWQGVIISASEQCGRNILPTLQFKSSIQTCFKELNDTNKILLDFDGASIKKLTSSLNSELGFTLLVGPEGGFTTDEIQQAKQQGFNSCTLGPRILRMETAATSIINIIQHNFGDMR